MAFGTPGSRSQARGPSPGFRFTLYAVLSFVVMFLDQRHGWLEQVRFVLQSATYPIQLAVNSPASAWKWLQEVSETRDALRAENARLRDQDRLLAVRAMRYEALNRENSELRGLREALPPVAERWLAAEIVSTPNRLRERVLINRGTANGVFKGQALLDERGVLGQTTHKGFVGFDDFALAADLLERVALNGKPDAMEHEPRGLLGNTERPVDFVARD